MGFLEEDKNIARLKNVPFDSTKKEKVMRRFVDYWKKWFRTLKPAKDSKVQKDPLETCDKDNDMILEPLYNSKQEAFRVYKKACHGAMKRTDPKILAKKLGLESLVIEDKPKKKSSGKKRRTLSDLDLEQRRRYQRDHAK